MGVDGSRWVDRGPSTIALNGRPVRDLSSARFGLFLVAYRGSNRIFFERQQQFIPIIHPGRYLQAFYSAPHMKPPMSLQYAIWALTSNGHPKYKSYHEIFYQRARKYIDADEMKVFLHMISTATGGIQNHVNYF